MEKQPNEIGLRVLLFQENSMWIAQCLDHDFATQGRSTRIALDALERLVLGQIALDKENQLEPLQDISSAPRENFEYWQAGKRVATYLSFKRSS